MMVDSYRGRVLTMLTFRSARRIIGAYADGKPFSIELVAAVRFPPISLVLMAQSRNIGYQASKVHREDEQTWVAKLQVLR